MKAPKVTLENHSAVYDFYATHQQSPRTALALYAFLASVYKPQVHYAPDVREQITAMIDDGAGFLIALNHLTNTHDQYIAAGTAWESPLRAHIGHMRVLGKDDLFRRRSRRVIDNLGGVPVFRSKDHQEPDDIPLLRAAGSEMLSISAQRLVDGDSLAIFPEGSHNKTDPLTLQKVNSGIGHIAQRAAALDANFAILPIGISYGNKLEPDSVRHASVYVGEPFTDFDGDSKPFRIAKDFTPVLQASVDGAHAHHHSVR